MPTRAIAINSFYLLLISAITLTILNIATENKVDKALSIYNLVIYILGFILIVYTKFKPGGIDSYKRLIGLITVSITLLTLGLSIENISDDKQKDKILPTIVLILSLFFIGIIFLFIPGHHYKLMYGTD